MVFANVIFDGDRSGSVNIGDDLQLIGVENVYKSMGIPCNDVVRIGLSQLSSYDGEYAILPISFPLYGYTNNTFITCFSHRIIPVFLALSIMTDSISEEECVYLRHFEPIGCRDYHTVKILRNHNVLAYLNGCLTAALPKVEQLAGSRVYLIDVPQRYYRYIPSQIQENAVITTQVLKECDDPEKEMKKRLVEYAENARLVVTTRLHAALPCIAMGLPVVFMKDNYSFRFPVLSRYIHPYTSNEFEMIDWNPVPVNYEDDKKRIIEVAVSRIRTAYETYGPMYDLSEYYEKDNIRDAYHIEHFDNVISDTREFFKKHHNAKYAVWGITQKADMICNYLEKEYPESKLVVVQDRKTGVFFHGVNSTNDVQKLTRDIDFIFVTAATVNDEAKRLFEVNNITNYHVSTDGIGE